MLYRLMWWHRCCHVVGYSQGRGTLCKSQHQYPQDAWEVEHETEWTCVYTSENPEDILSAIYKYSHTQHVKSETFLVPMISNKGFSVPVTQKP